MASVSNNCFVKNMRLLAAALEDAVFAVHPVFEALFAKRMDEAMRISQEVPGWGRCLVPLDHPKLQGSSILHLVAGQPPPRGYVPGNWEVWLSIIVDEVVFSQTIVRGLSAASCTMCLLVR